MAKLIRAVDALHRLKRRIATRHGDATGVLLVSAGGLGDTVLFSRVLPRFMLIAGDDEPVTVLLRHDGAKTAFLFADTITTEIVDFRRFDRRPAYRWAVLDRLYRANYRRVISTDYLRHPYLDEAMIAATEADCAAMEARPWAKYDKALRRNRSLFQTLVESEPPRTDKVLRWARFADRLIGGVSSPPVLAEQRVADRTQTIFIQPFSAVAAKHSPPELYAAIIKALPAGFEVAITGTARDLENSPEFASLLDLPKVRFDASGFADLMPRLRTAALVVSVDTALMHLAVVAGAPTLCLASAAYVGEIVPYDPRIIPDNAHFEYVAMPCEGCLGACIHPLEDGMYRCVAGLNAAAIVDRVLKLLA